MRQGEVWWVRFGGEGSEPMGRRPAVVVQSDAYNDTALGTTVVAAVTSNIQRAGIRGNVRLRPGEAGLEKASVVQVTHIRTMDRSRLLSHIGTLSPSRLREVQDGLALVFGLEPAP